MQHEANMDEGEVPSSRPTVAVGWVRRASWGLLLSVAAVLAAALPSAALQQTLVSRGSTWRYVDGGADPGSGWADPAYDDAAWRAGPAQLGYGDGDEATVVGYGADPNAKAVTTHFRRAFTVSGAAALGRLELNLLRDDGAVVYLNGIEIRRDNLPAGAISSATPATAPVGGADESVYVASATDGALLREGVNLLAVEVHQSSGASSDISFDLELVASDAGVGVIRGPYLQRGTPTGVVVRWRTDLPTDSRVRYGTAAEALTASAGSASPATEHVVALDGLTPDTQYVYAVGTTAGSLAGGDATHTFRTAPPAGSAARTRIWVIGDSGTGGSGPRTVRDAYATFAGAASPDLWLMLGDNAYSSGTDVEYQTGVFDVYPAVLRTSVLWPTLGNHDGLSADSATQSGPYYDIFTLPGGGEAGGLPSGTEAYYAFDYGRIHFVCLDSYETDRSPGSPMLRWLANDLSAASADWVIAFWHHPPYSKGSHDSDVDTELTQMRQNVLPVLEAYGVDLVLSGHSHAYERSMLLDGHYGVSTTLQPTMILDPGDGRVEGDGAYRKPSLGRSAHQGAVYAVVGSSARAGGGALNHPAMRVSLNAPGSLVLDIDHDVLSGRFLSDAGAVLDAFTITKGAVAEAGLQGTIRYFRDLGPVPGVALTGHAVSAADGSFTVAAPIGAPVVLAPARRGAAGAVSALDAAWVLQAVAGLRTLDATQQLACDVTANGTLSALDAAEILRLTVGLSPRLPATDLCGSDFVFTPAAGAALNQVSRAPQLISGTCRPGALGFEPVAASAGAQDFLAAALGDCTGNWQAPAAGAALMAKRAGGARVRVGPARRLADGRTRQVIVVRGAPALSAVELLLQVPAGGALRAVHALRPAGDAVVRFAPAAGGRVRLALASPRALRALRLLAIADAPRGAAPLGVVTAHVDELPATVTSQRTVHP